jgi:hypothetical protein
MTKPQLLDKNDRGFGDMDNDTPEAQNEINESACQ